MRAQAGNKNKPVMYLGGKTPRFQSSPRMQFHTGNSGPVSVLIGLQVQL